MNRRQNGYLGLLAFSCITSAVLVMLSSFEAAPRFVFVVSALILLSSMLELSARLLRIRKKNGHGAI